ncbi:hypothetical protein GQ43DRAFT_497576 [Delitschia confertaspora ATCC 74209]|uniref:Uncharacterized protein n=1 Tax=Delitschia confertaspora ATCC 74209 TaxID=1513339 RepID=A0A9P4JHP5_9PLEO|nr:hypothetical protein GQ43DRAFT_497576 [Delitschia confertaspora ATCC 74209]
MLSVKKGKILPNVRFKAPSPAICLEGLKIRVPQEVLDRYHAMEFAAPASTISIVVEAMPMFYWRVISSRKSI